MVKSFDQELLKKIWPMKRWYKLVPHQIQLQLIQNPIRFKVCAAGRRSGKSERAKRFIVKEAFKNPGMYFCAAPTRDQAKRIFWKDLKLMVPDWFVNNRISESYLIIPMINGSELHVVGLDKPARVEGQPWMGGIVDEVADCKPGIWNDHLRPLFDTIGLNTWCWLIGVPDGLNDFYDLAEYAQGDDADWRFYTWKSAEILPVRAIKKAKQQMSPKQFRTEYEASFETATGRVYEDYSNHNRAKVKFNPKLPLIWTHDFNFTPLSSALIQEDIKKDKTFVVDEIVLESAVARNSAIEFIDRYEKYKDMIPMVKIYGDSSGHIGDKHGIRSEYKILELMLKKTGFNVEMNAPRKNPSIKDSQNSLRGRILNADGQTRLFVNPNTCKYVDKGLKTVQLQKGGSFQEKDSEYQHITTALRYYTSVEHKINDGTAETVRIYGT